MSMLLAKIAAKVSKKEERIIQANAEFKDVNKPFIKAVFGISIWGKSAFDEEIMELIVGEFDDVIGEGKRGFQRTYDEAKKKFGSDLRKRGGYITDPDGLIYLIPKV